MLNLKRNKNARINLLRITKLMKPKFLHYFAVHVYRCGHKNANKTLAGFCPLWAPADPSGSVSHRETCRPLFSNWQTPLCIPCSCPLPRKPLALLWEHLHPYQERYCQCSRSARLRGQSRDSLHPKVERPPPGTYSVPPMPMHRTRERLSHTSVWTSCRRQYGQGTQIT